MIQYTHIFVADPSLSVCHDFGSVQLVVKHCCAPLKRRTCNQHLMNTVCRVMKNGYMHFNEVDLLLWALILHFNGSKSCFTIAFFQCFRKTRVDNVI